MKPHQSILCAIALIPISFSIVSASDTMPANASKQTDRQWKQYLGGRKIVHFSRYSSSFGGGGSSSQSELHFCKNGQFAYASQSSVSMSAGDVSGNSNGRDGNVGTWKIIESNQQAVVVEVADNNGQKGQFALGFGNDGKLYSGGKRFFPAPSDACS